MKANDKLSISFSPSIETYNSISEILGRKPTEQKFKNLSFEIPSLWTYEVITTEIDPYFDSINTFLNLLENKYEVLSKIGIQKSDILIWYLYEYDKECNMEFDPIRMKRLGENGIKLCISCWASKKE